MSPLLNLLPHSAYSVFSSIFTGPLPGECAVNLRLFNESKWRREMGLLGTVKPIFHWKWGSRWVPNANEMYTKNMKCTWPTPAFCVGTRRNLYSTDWRRGLASGITQILGLASGVTQILALGNAKIYQHVGISNAKFWRQGNLPNAYPRCQVFCVAVEYRLKAYIPL